MLYEAKFTSLAMYAPHLTLTFFELVEQISLIEIDLTSPTSRYEMGSRYEIGSRYDVNTSRRRDKTSRDRDKDSDKKSYYNDLRGSRLIVSTIGYGKCIHFGDDIWVNTTYRLDDVFIVDSRDIRYQIAFREDLEEKLILV
ncbi:hypothetical protein IEQ34_013488 [Dendrobium chrysotoxum]|uniref:Uncharacterized protein n=1 Tax=Dendrobium chrysotoxum TaxID=161865 RepID=A0AAV7GR55_DENCH|nr:hypothetical protein IEQ34_013488 [Dendrobium chrysotoxum]